MEEEQFDEIDETLEKIRDDIMDINEEITNLYKKLLDSKLSNNDKMYKQTILELKRTLEIEKDMYKKLTFSQSISLLNYFNSGELRNRFSIFDKFYNLAFQYYEIDDEKRYRILNYLRDRCIMLDKISKFNDEDIYEYDEEEFEEEDITLDYENKMLNTLLVEFQLFADLLKLFICTLNYYIKNTFESELKENLLNYKNIIAFTYAKDDISIIEEDINFENTFILSKLLYDVLIESGREVAYNYEIIKRDYLDKTLYEFFKNFYNLESIKVPEFRKIIQKSYLISLLMLYQDEFDMPRMIFNQLKKVNYDDSHIESLLSNDKKIVANAKVLTLTK